MMCITQSDCAVIHVFDSLHSCSGVPAQYQTIHLTMFNVSDVNSLIWGQQSRVTLVV